MIRTKSRPPVWSHLTLARYGLFIARKVSPGVGDKKEKIPAARPQIPAQNGWKKLFQEAILPALALAIFPRFGQVYLQHTIPQVVAV